MAGAKRSINCTSVKLIAAAAVAASYWVLDSLVKWVGSDLSLLQSINPFGASGLQRTLVAVLLAAAVAVLMTIYTRRLEENLDTLNSCDTQYRAIMRSTRLLFAAEHLLPGFRGVNFRQ